MPRYEYKVVPAPTKGRKGKGVRGAEARFSFALQYLMNDMGAQGWEYQRAETLPSTERAGLSGTTTEWRNILIFRKIVDEDLTVFQPELLPAPHPEAPPDVIVAPTMPAGLLKEFQETPQINGHTPTSNSADNGVEDLADEDAKNGPGSALSVLARNRSVAKVDEKTDD